jgi:hypothetical protein
VLRGPLSKRGLHALHAKAHAKRTNKTRVRPGKTIWPMILHQELGQKDYISLLELKLLLAAADV